MLIEWFHWAILGIFLMLTELVVPSFVLVWFGLGALVVGFTLSVFPFLDIVSQLQLWTIFSVLAIIVWFKVFKPAHHKILVGRSSAEAIGEVGLLVDDVDTFKKSHVRFQKPLMGSDIWECLADSAIKAGSRVKVVSVEGNVVKVKSAEK